MFSPFHLEETTNHWSLSAWWAYGLAPLVNDYTKRECFILSWLHWIKMMIPMLRAVAWLATRDTHACVWENIRTHDWKWPVCLLLSLLAWFWPFRPGYGLSGLVMAFLACVWPFWHSVLPDYLRNRSHHLCWVVELSTVFWTWFTREFAETVLFHRVGRSTLSD